MQAAILAIKGQSLLGKSSAKIGQDCRLPASRRDSARRADQRQDRGMFGYRKVGLRQAAQPSDLRRGLAQALA